MKLIIIGLGNFGLSLAEELLSAGYEVVGIDVSPAKIEEAKDMIPSVFCLNATDKMALSVVDIRKDDIFLVAIGKDFGDSIKIVATLKSFSRNPIYARAVNRLHESVLEGLDVARILNPEKDSSRVFVQSMPMKGMVEIMKADEKHSIVKLTATEKLNGITVGRNGFDRFSLKVLMMSKRTAKKNMIGLTFYTQEVVENFSNDTVINTGDTIVVYGENDNIKLYLEYYSN